MTGIARKLFSERMLKNLIADLDKVSKWTLLETMLQEKRLGYVDLSLSRQLIGGEAEESIAAFICHLSMASRYGHICTLIENGNINPPVEEIWVADDTDLVNASRGNLEKIRELVLMGAEKIAGTLVCEVDEGDCPVNTPIVKCNHHYYLQRYWALETVFLKHYTHLYADSKQVSPLSLPINREYALNRVCLLEEEHKLLPEQALAITTAVQFPLTIITGGPGTGKTYTAGMLLRILWESLQTEDRARVEIALAAPTGKAAANLEYSIKSALKGVEEFHALKAQTLHQLLGIRRNSFNHRPVKLTADIILVDESSMIDIGMMGMLFAAVKQGARVIMLGDRNQLPSVEAGSLFADLANYLVKISSTQLVELKTCLRTELKSIIGLADFIKKGKVDEVFAFLDSDAEGISFEKIDDKISIHEQQRRFLDEVIPNFPVYKKLPENPIELIEGFNRFRILTPLRKGVFGVDALNAMIYRNLRSKVSSNQCFIAPIMVMQNDYRLGLFNGEVGLIVSDKESEYALFASRDTNQEYRKIPLLMMPPFEYAYCLSVHKSQGSEFEQVVMLLPEGTQSFGREALYTGVTRAKRYLKIWSHPQVLSQMMKLTAVRQSGVVHRLMHAITGLMR
jgi:exodeoxyribonuclease V alpha subunit